MSTRIFAERSVQRFNLYLQGSSVWFFFVIIIRGKQCYLFRNVEIHLLQYFAIYITFAIKMWFCGLHFWNSISHVGRQRARRVHVGCYVIWSRHMTVIGQTQQEESFLFVVVDNIFLFCPAGHDRGATLCSRCSITFSQCKSLEDFVSLLHEEDELS